jgi:glutathione S-transferase
MNYVRQLDKVTQEKPLLFSYRRCPYAMRARMALLSCGVDFDIFEISLKNKPQQMIKISPKGTVPVFVYKNLVLDESIDIMNWATEQQNNNFIKINPHDWALIKSMIKINDGEFKNKLDQYKYTSNKEASLKTKYRKECEIYIKNIDERLEKHEYLLSNNFGYLDMAIFPFIRQFFHVDLNWFEEASYINLKNWVEKISTSDLFTQIMKKPTI